MKLVFENIETEDAPIPLAKYSQATIAGNVLSLAGQISIDPKTNNLVGEEVGMQIAQTIRNIDAIKSKGHKRLEELGVSNKYARVNYENKVFYVNPEDLKTIKTICSNRFPVYSLEYVKAEKLPKGALVEIRLKETFMHRFLGNKNFHRMKTQPCYGSGSDAIEEVKKELKELGFGLERVFYAEVSTNNLQSKYPVFNETWEQMLSHRPSRAMFQKEMPHDFEITFESYLGKLEG